MHHPEAHFAPDNSDIALAVAARAGDQEAFGALVQMHMKRAYIVAFRLLHNREDAEDLVQEAFVVAFQKLDAFQPGRPFAPWFFRVLVNRGLNMLEAKRVRATTELTDDAASHEPAPDVTASQSELMTDLRNALDHLPPRQRALIELVELEGFTPTEAAEHLFIAPATARWHLHTARHTLQELLRKYR